MKVRTMSSVRDMMDDQEWNRVARYITGEATPDERDAVRRWIDADNARAELLNEMSRTWKVAKVDPNEWDVRSALTQVKSKFGEKPSPRSGDYSRHSAR